MRVDTPSNVNELRDVLRSTVAAPRKCSLLAGGTDLLVHLRASPGFSPDLIDLSGVKELKCIEMHRDRLEIGACTTFTEIEEHSFIQEHFSALARAASLVGSPQIRNLGTIGGNLANASPAADSLPPLCALEATLLVENAEGAQSTLSPAQIASAPGKNSLHADQYIRAVLLPLRENLLSFFVKTGSRKAVAISKLSLALALSSEPGHVRLFAGSLGTSPIRMEAAEAVLDRRDWTEANHTAFLDALSGAVERAIPGRASLPFKRLAVRGLGDDLWTAAKEAISRG